MRKVCALVQHLAKREMETEAERRNWMGNQGW
jgi:hypothetical protein